MSVLEFRAGCCPACNPSAAAHTRDRLTSAAEGKANRRLPSAGSDTKAETFPVRRPVSQPAPPRGFFIWAAAGPRMSFVISHLIPLSCLFALLPLFSSPLSLSRSGTSYCLLPRPTCASSSSPLNSLPIFLHFAISLWKSIMHLLLTLAI